MPPDDGAIGFTRPGRRGPREDLEELRAMHLAAFAHLYNIRPWEWPLLEVHEALALIAALPKPKE